MAFPYKGFRATKPKARLADSDRRYYEVFFYIYPAGQKRVLHRFSKDINKANVSERKTEAETCAALMHEALRDGWNPLVQKYPEFKQEQERRVNYTLSAALDFALDKKLPSLSKWSRYDYKGCVRFIKKAAIECYMLDQPITSVKRKDIRLLIATAKELNEWSSNARNKYLTIVKSLLSVLVDEDMIDFNPAHGIKNEKHDEGAGYARLSNEEKELIAKHIAFEAPEFFEYLMFIYQSGIRRKELLMIQVKDISLQRREITIRPEVAKTNCMRKVPITDDLMDILINRQVWTLSPNYYLFSSDKFNPGPTMYSPNTPTDWWRKLVIKGLGIDCKMYSLKHKGADDKIEAGIDLDVLRTLYGHKSKQMTEIYAKAVREKYKQTLINQSPVFAKVVQMERKTGG